MSTAMVSAAQSVRFARRVCNRNNAPDCTVNSKSCASRNSASSSRQISFSRAKTAGSTVRQPVIVAQTLAAGDDVLALAVELKVEIQGARAGRRIAGEADAGTRRAAGVAEHHVCTVTAVPASSPMPFSRR